MLFQNLQTNKKKYVNLKLFECLVNPYINPYGFRGLICSSINIHQVSSLLCIAILKIDVKKKHTCSLRTIFRGQYCRQRNFYKRKEIDIKAKNYADFEFQRYLLKWLSYKQKHLSAFIANFFTPILRIIGGKTQHGGHSGYFLNYRL